jgi:hypothetical protein
MHWVQPGRAVPLLAMALIGSSHTLRLNIQGCSLIATALLQWWCTAWVQTGRAVCFAKTALLAVVMHISHAARVVPLLLLAMALLAVIMLLGSIGSYHAQSRPIWMMESYLGCNISWIHARICQSFMWIKRFPMTYLTSTQRSESVHQHLVLALASTCSMSDQESAIQVLLLLEVFLQFVSSYLVDSMGSFT